MSTNKLRPDKKTRWDTARKDAKGKWGTIIPDLIGADPALFLGGNKPCPGCGGDDRFDFSDLDGDGSTVCRKCGNTGNGFQAIEKYTGKSKSDVLIDVEKYLGIQKPGPKDADPAADLEFLPWNDLAVLTWGLWKQPITPRAVQAIGGRLARYRCMNSVYSVIAIPVLGPKLLEAKPVGWVLYNQSGGELPKFVGKDKPIEWVKVKLTFGSTKGIILDHSRLVSARTLVKVEGPSDLMALLTMPGLPDSFCPFTTANGTGEKPEPWIAAMSSSKQVIVIHDADNPGESGAVTWANKLAIKATSCRHVRLPYEVTKDHGKDLRDWIIEGATYSELAERVDAAAVVVPQEKSTDKAIRKENDPDRSAMVNLEGYAKKRPGGTLRQWRGIWFKFNGTRLKEISDNELFNKVWASCKAEFERLNIEHQKTKSKDEEDTEATPTTTFLVNNVIRATASLVYIPDSVELDSWFNEESGKFEKRSYLAMQNGILDIERTIGGSDDDTLKNWLLPHSPNWFSTVYLPYNFDPDAECPLWEKYLERSLEGDETRIKLLQEWAGYCLTTDTTLQKFMALEGEGANGKSVYLAGVTGILGRDNCSFVPLEQFSERFQIASMMGQLLNICPDTAELDKVAEGFLKAFTSGGEVHFERKGKDHTKGMKPTARIAMAFNTRPRFSDRTNGLWRRMLLVPFKIQIPVAERVPGMDTAEWWASKGELPGMLNWAITGLAKLRAKRGFTQSAISDEALKDYRAECNSAKAFLNECMEPEAGRELTCLEVYEQYKNWCIERGMQPFKEHNFGNEVAKVFPFRERERYTTGSRKWYYKGIDFIDVSTET